jgi:hypothetical protein
MWSQVDRKKERLKVAWSLVGSPQCTESNARRPTQYSVINSRSLLRGIGGQSTSFPFVAVEASQGNYEDEGQQDLQIQLT